MFIARIGTDGDYQLAVRSARDQMASGSHHSTGWQPDGSPEGRGRPVCGANSLGKAGLNARRPRTHGQPDLVGPPDQQPPELRAGASQIRSGGAAVHNRRSRVEVDGSFARAKSRRTECTAGKRRGAPWSSTAPRSRMPSATLSFKIIRRRSTAWSEPRSIQVGRIRPADQRWRASAAGGDGCSLHSTQTQGDTGCRGSSRPARIG